MQQHDEMNCFMPWAELAAAIEPVWSEVAPVVWTVSKRSMGSHHESCMIGKEKKTLSGPNSGIIASGLVSALESFRLYCARSHSE